MFPTEWDDQKMDMSMDDAGVAGGATVPIVLYQDS